MQQPITFDKFIRWTLIALAIIAAFFIVKTLSGVLLPFFIAWLFAYLLHPTVKFVQFKLHVPTRALSIIATFLFVVAIIAGISYFIIPPLIEQFEKFIAIATHYLQSTSETNSISAAIQEWINEHQKDIEKFLNSQNFTKAIQTAMPKVFAVIGQTASIILSIIASFITLLYLFFILLDYEKLTTKWIKIFPKNVRPFWTGLAQDVERELNNYIRGQGMVSLIMGILFAIGFTIIGFPMAIGMGILIGILNLVPYLHTFALIPAALLALLKAADTGQNFWLVLLSAIAVFIIVQLICDMIVTPKVMGKAMGLNPAILLLSLSVWGVLLGFIGLIVALPLTTLLIAYWKRYVTKETDEDNAPESPSTPSAN
ncbi:AI-2E family transporter [Prevotella brunnea]|uniref:AI-2E family transporter n=1 Tax=Prevotella brunnea TaxID=2508867 RepID=A0A5C8GM54_9BACT|nr:AI-2E family transporter [Prevotella brunnea]MDR0185236.1 AI-2E family transporter [Prevotella brunnea]TXJ63197.1 AI-2E family transporter [Prevotella brunnea]